MIQCWSISHQKAPLTIREKINLTVEERDGWLACHQSEQTEVVVLATCNRLELYVDAPETQMAAALWGQLLAVRGLTPDDLLPYTMHYVEWETALHLFRVGSGLESIAIGESQILGQTIRAFEQAQRQNTSGPVLSLLFRSAIHAAKKVQTETCIGAGSVSMSAMGIRLAEQNIGTLEGRSVLVLGAGEMGQGVVRGLVQRGVANISLVNRTVENARSLAERWGVQIFPISHLREALAEADVLFATATTPSPILNEADLAAIIEKRPNRPLCIVDIAVPRNVEESAVAGVEIYNVDDVVRVVDENLNERQRAIPLAEQILHSELAQFWQEYQGRVVVQTIQQLRERVEQMRQLELSRILNRLPSVNDGENVQALFEEFSHRLMNKMLHQPTNSLKIKAGEGQGALFASLTRDLFGLEEAAT